MFTQNHHDQSPDPAAQGMITSPTLLSWAQ
jgi:hypothetical protein